MNSLCGPHKILCSGLDLAHGPWVWYRWFMLLYAFALHISLHVPHISGLPLAPPPPFLTVSPLTGHTFGTAPTPGGREKNFRSRKRGTWWAHIKQDCVLTGQPFSKSTVGPVKCFHILQINNYFFLITVAYCFIAALICQGALIWCSTSTLDIMLTVPLHEQPTAKLQAVYVDHHHKLFVLFPLRFLFM